MHEDDAKAAAVKMKPMEMPENASSSVAGLLLAMADVKKLPHAEMVTEFMCIEGWSEIVYWGGARLRDFVAAFPPIGLPEYIGFETPDGQYYVGIEREVALHPQTLLAYELNGKPLTPDHGAPLRLVTPLKYGIKQLKQIGRMTYTETRPRDYWHEQGYDYYASIANLVRNSGPRILYCNQHAIAVSRGLNANLSAARHSFKSVRNQVKEHQLHSRALRGATLSSVAHQARSELSDYP